ncbi:hypothetical protein NG895_27430 [Aeoliella sp. ICT_H6.2]|uniref:Uncharacterized protein n=1 Tax=Aeoliella straminimaris TaxID=2954799 RepID=A0A9X2JKY2_9BACT|nr:hypothetical protein [Aeoliella straminimaris]MCO6047654.1 hypothetical protein [Aeoliella straminimaris]
MPYLFHIRIFWALLAVAATVCVSAHDCRAAGRWNLPSTANQYMGFGFGPGYHAPMVMGPAWRGKAASPGVRRVPTAWKPACGGFGMPCYSAGGYPTPASDQPELAPPVPQQVAPQVLVAPVLLFDAPAAPSPTPAAGEVVQPGASAPASLPSP